MNNDIKQKLTAAFEDGKDAARDMNRGFSSRLRHKGMARDFFETAFFKEEKIIAAEEKAYYASPEYAAHKAKTKAFVSDLASALSASAKGDAKAANFYADRTMEYFS